MSNRPFISVVTATYNSADLVQRCIDSVATQTFRDFEHLIIDGASTDETVSIIRMNQNKLAYWISEPDTGIYNAWNKAIPHIKGEWVLFLGSDDRLADDRAFEKMVPYLRAAYPKTRLVYGKLLYEKRGNGEVLFVDGEPWENLRGKFRKAGLALPPHPSMFQHISLFKSMKPFDEKFKIAGDTKFLAQEILLKDPLFIPVEVTRFSLGGISGSLGKRELQMWNEDRRVSKELRIPVPVTVLMISFWKALVKECILRLFGEKVLFYIVNYYRKMTCKKTYITSKKNKGR